MEIGLAIVGVLIAIITFYFSFYRKPTGELDNFKAQFRATQKLSMQVQQAIEEYASRTNSWENPIFSDFTFRTYLKQMKESYRTNLSDELYDQVFRSKLTIANIGSMLKDLEKQQSSLLEIQTEVNMRLKQIV